VPDAQGPRPVPEGGGWEAELARRFPALGRLKLARRARGIPYVQQVSAADCGAACLAMVLAYHGQTLSLEEVRTVTGFGRDGANALTLLKAGRWFGLRGRGLKVESLDDLRHVPTASILHWGFNHFVVFSHLVADGAELAQRAQLHAELRWADREKQDLLLRVVGPGDRQRAYDAEHAGPDAMRAQRRVPLFRQLE